MGSASGHQAALGLGTFRSADLLHCILFLSRPSSGSCFGAAQPRHGRRDVEPLSPGFFRCRASPLHVLSYEVEPIVDLAVTVSPGADAGGPPAATGACSIEMRGLRLGGSNAVVEQNRRFKAACCNRLAWGDKEMTSTVEFELELEMFSGAFRFMPRAHPCASLAPRRGRCGGCGG